MQIRPGIELAALSDLGCQRENNEDRYSYWEARSEEQFAVKGRLLSVADGMGGYEGGQEASRVAIEAVEEAYANGDGNDPQSSLLSGFRRAHQKIQEYADHHPGLQGMGTTCTAIALLGHRLYFAHIGDSRLYLVRDSSISRLTHDHSYVSRLVAQGVISLEEAESHPQRHILTAALGAGSEVEPDYPERPIELRAGDVLVICTDGLWSIVRDDEIRDAIEGHSPEAACRQLVDLARERGGPDNITLQVLRVP
jgi:serine/threonine protein phosphatase PrpC